MNRLPKGIAGVLGSLVVVAVAAGVSYGAAALIGGLPSERVVDSQDANPQPRITAGICVESIAFDADGKVSKADIQEASNAVPVIQSTFAEVSATNPYWDSAIGKAPLVVDAGCPSLPLPATSGLAWAGDVPAGGRGVQTVARPSRYPLFLYILPSAVDIEVLLGSPIAREAIQEMKCLDPKATGACTDRSVRCEECTTVEVTRAIYLTQDEVATSSPMLHDLIESGFGLR